MKIQSPSDSNGLLDLTSFGKTYKTGFLLLTVFLSSCSVKNDDLKSYVETKLKKVRHEDSFVVNLDSLFSRDWTKQMLIREMGYTKQLAMQSARTKVRRDSVLNWEADDSNYIDRSEALKKSKKLLQEIISGNYESDFYAKERIDRINALMQDPPSYHKFIARVPGDELNEKTMIIIVRLSKVRPDEDHSTGSDTTIISFEPVHYHRIYDAIGLLDF